MNTTDNKLKLSNHILQLQYNTPFDFIGIIKFLSKRTLTGVEAIIDDTYMRTMQIGIYSGWVSVQNIPLQNVISVEISVSLTAVLSVVLDKIRNIFDLNACPNVITTKLMEDSLLTELVTQNLGLRVPGAFNGFELAIRAVLGQQIAVKAASTLAGRFTKAFGENISTPFSELTTLCPTPERIVQVGIDEIVALGIIRSRATSIVLIAQKIISGQLTLNDVVDPEETIAQLVEIKGIGPWTAHYIAMRVFKWTDAFPAADMVLRKNLGNVTAKQAESLSQKWRPWRSYATMHLWHKSV